MPALLGGEKAAGPGQDIPAGGVTSCLPPPLLCTVKVAGLLADREQARLERGKGPHSAENIGQFDQFN